MMNEFFHRFLEVAQHKLALFLSWLTAGTVAFDGVVKKSVAVKAVEQGLTLADWQIIVGIIFTVTMIIPRLYAGYIWLKKKINSKNSKK